MSGPSKESMERAREWIVESGLFQKLDHFKFPSSLATLLDEVRADERESCAKVVDGFVDTQEFTAARKAENDAPASAVMHMIQSRYYAALASAIRERTR